MAVSKRTRYEVLKRDNHTCRYCGARPPDAVLTVDHVVPVSLGGSDDPDNMVAACKDCNAGKSSTTPSDALVAEVGEDDMRWAAAVRRAADAALEAHELEVSRHSWFYREWREWDETCSSLPAGADQSLDHWLGGGLPRELVLDALSIALRNRNVRSDDVFRYMGGICRKKLEALHEAARAILDAEGAPDGT